MTQRSFVTGGTGLLGRHLVPRLFAREEHVLMLVRPATLERDALAFEALRLEAEAAGARLELVPGDVTKPSLGIDAARLDELGVDALDHVFHLAGRYDLVDDDPDATRAINVDGTKHLLGLLVDRGFSGVLHHVSSVAVAGDHEGRFAEDDLHVKQRLAHPYFETKHASEALVREAKDLRWRVYRPSAVVGHSVTGEMDRIDGPYYLLRAVHKLRNALPPWVTLPGYDGPTLNMVPVDYVADAIDAIAHRDGFDGRGFHLVDPAPPKFYETFNLFAEAAGAPRMSKKRVGKLLKKLIPGANNMLPQLGSLKFLRREWAEDFGIPALFGELANGAVEYDTRNVDEALRGTSIRCPRVADYADPMWDHYRRFLEPSRNAETKAARDRRELGDKRVVVTGASSGVGLALSKRLAAAGAHVILVARREEELMAAVSAIREAGGRADHHVADLNDLDACDRLIAHVHETHGPIDVLVNNAARSIRRPLAESLERFHDLERVMQLNFYAPARLIRGVLPEMRERGGVIVNVLTAGAHFPSARFGVYTASKAALSQLGDVLAAEHLHEGVRVSNVYLHWVRTPMMDASAFEDTDAMSPEEAAEQIADGIAERKQHVLRPTDLRRFVLARVHPAGLTRIMNLLYRIYADDPAAHPEVALDRVLLTKMVPGKLF